MFIVEGPDYSGKTGLIRRIESEFGPEAYFTQEPGGTMFGLDLRRLMKSHDLDNITYLLGMYAARQENILKAIIPATNLQAVRCIVSDRFDLSTYVYQVRYQEQECPEARPLFAACREASVEMLQTSGIELHYIILDVSPEVGYKRKAEAFASNERSAEDGAEDAIEAKYNSLEALRKHYIEGIDDFMREGYVHPNNVTIIDTSDLDPETVAVKAMEFINSKI